MKNEVPIKKKQIFGSVSVLKSDLGCSSPRTVPRKVPPPVIGDIVHDVIPLYRGENGDSQFMNYDIPQIKNKRLVYPLVNQHSY
jgi:hypothetical protein